MGGEIIMKKYILFLFAVSLFISCDTNSELSASGENSVAGSTARFTLNGNTLYLINGNNLETYNMDDDGKLTLLDARLVSTDVETIFSRGDALFLGTSSGMYIYSLTGSRIPNYQSFYNHIISCDPVVADSNFAYLTLNNSSSLRCNRGVNQLEIIDIKDLKNPELLKVYAMKNPRGLAVSGNLLFVCDTKFKIYDKSNADSLVLLKELNIRADDVIPNNGTLFLTTSNGFYQYIEEADTLKLISSIPIGQ